MGTNYYFSTKKYRDMPRVEYTENEYGDGIRGIHIGKSSMGWCFSLHVYPEYNINILEDWKNIINNDDEGLIVDENGDIISVDDLIEIITSRRKELTIKESFNKIRDILGYYSNYDDYMNKNSAVEGPNNLMRAKIDGIHCIGHGEGTYDYIVGEFS